MAILLCAPIYAPDPGHEDPWKFAGPFYAVVHSDWKGAVTSPESLEEMCRAYPGASVWKAQPWLAFLRMWTLDCTEYHVHPEGEVAQDPPPPSPYALRLRPRRARHHLTAHDVKARTIHPQEGAYPELLQLQLETQPGGAGRARVHEAACGAHQPSPPQPTVCTCPGRASCGGSDSTGLILANPVSSILGVCYICASCFRSHSGHNPVTLRFPVTRSISE
ncbi:hypothetical protein B0H10DRAFT_1953190 [Mycena sp. CBHHK59/15]|nr:hypothetical protein B0H10DRAFT_1953190 [Mycena sp. CBHHK59/15]